MLRDRAILDYLVSPAPLNFHSAIWLWEPMFAHSSRLVNKDSVTLQRYGVTTMTSRMLVKL